MTNVDFCTSNVQGNPPIAHPANPKVLWSVAVLGCYAAISLCVYWPASLLSSTKMVGGGVGDPAGQVAGLAWPLYALSHGMTPFFSLWTNYPIGINLATNPIALPVGLLVWPISAALGPIAAFNFAMCFAFFSAAACMYFVLRRVVSLRFPAFIGGLVYGFSPYMIGQGLGHVALVYTCILPIIFYLLFEVFVGQARNARHLGVTLGCVLSLQAYLSIELLADTFLVTVLCVIIFGAMHWRVLRARLRYVVESSAVALGAFALCSGYLLVYELAGPLHLSGPTQAIAGLTLFHADLLGLIVPTYLQRFSPHDLAVIGSTYSANNRAENGIYVGLPLLLVCTCIAVAMRRNCVVRVSVVVGVIAWIFALGTRLSVNNHSYNVPLPWAIVTHIPLIDGEVPGRYSLFVQMAVAVIFAMGIEKAAIFIHQRDPSRIARWNNKLTTWALHPRVSLALLLCVICAVLAPLAPSIPLPIGRAGVPSLFRSSLLDKIPQSSVLLAYPYPQPLLYSEAQLWQAVAGYRFKLLGGYGVFRAVNGWGTPWPADLTPPEMQALFEEALTGVATLPGTANRLPPVELGQATHLALRAFLERYDVATIVVQPIGKDPRLVTRYLTTVVGRPQELDGLSVWFDVPKLLRLRR
jgi:hypothetical protein